MRGGCECAAESESGTEAGSGAVSQEEGEGCPEARIKAEAAALTARRNRLFLKDAIPDWIALIGYIAFGVLGPSALAQPLRACTTAALARCASVSVLLELNGEYSLLIS